MNSEEWMLREILNTGCLVCSRPTCDFYSKDCRQKKSALGTIPVYNNILEFGLSGKYFPSLTTVIIHLNKGCYYKVTASKLTHRNEILLRILECYTESNNCENGDRYDITYRVSFEGYQFCLFFGLAFYQPDRLHITSSRFCNTFASAKFNESVYFEMVDKETCFFDKSLHEPEAEFSFVQPQNEMERIVDGVPVILPCSPGGYAVDPETGRLVNGKTCWSMFGETMADDVGINFLINNMYGNDENLLFPRHNYRPRKMRPIYIRPDGTAASRKEMAPKKSTNQDAVGKKRNVCQYEDSFPRTPAPDAVKLKCREMLSSVRQIVKEDLEEAINAYIQNSTGCLICADLTNGNTSTLTLPVYHNLFEFGFSGQYFPSQATVVVNGNDNCRIRIEVLQHNDNFTVNIYECGSSNEECIQMPVTVNSYLILLNNWYCAQVGLAFHNPHRIYYAFSFRCDKFAATRFNDSVFVSYTKSSCRGLTQHKRANFELIQSVNSTIDGVPIIVPCSSGGYVVDSERGEFIVNETCDDMFWETLVNRTELSGIHFILKNLFQSNENFVFRKRSPDVPYPRPLYINENGQAMSPSNVLPTIVPNEDRRNLFREKCLFKRQQQIGNTPGSSTSQRTVTQGAENETTNKFTATPTTSIATGTILSTTTTTTTTTTGSTMKVAATSESNFNFKEIALTLLIVLKLIEIFIYLYFYSYI